MKIVQIAGFLGSGKTTLLLQVSAGPSPSAGFKVAMVVNEIGEIPVDGKVMEESGMKVKDIGGGCICCEVAATFAKTLGPARQGLRARHRAGRAHRRGHPPPGQGGGGHGWPLRPRWRSGPVIVLFDATRPDELLDMELMGRLVTSQLVDADIVAVSKVDVVDAVAVGPGHRGRAPERHPRSGVHPGLVGDRRGSGDRWPIVGDFAGREASHAAVTTPAIWTTGSAATGWPSSSTATSPWPRPRWATCCAR